LLKTGDEKNVRKKMRTAERGGMKKGGCIKSQERPSEGQ